MRVGIFKGFGIGLANIDKRIKKANVWENYGLSCYNLEEEDGMR